MWPSGWKRHRIPYRGEPEPKLPKRRKQIRNLRFEKRENVITISIIIVLMIIVFGCVILNSSNTNPNKLKQAIIVFIFTLMLILPIAAGFSSINKFRKGYDIDVSKKSESASVEPTEASNE